MPFAKKISIDQNLEKLSKIFFEKNSKINFMKNKIIKIKFL